MSPRQEARELLRPLFARPVSPEERRVCDELERVLEKRNSRIDELQAALDAQEEKMFRVSDDGEQYVFND